MVTLGILYVYLIGPYTTYFVLNTCCLAVPIVFAVLFLIVAPETPLYLLRKNRRYVTYVTIQSFSYTVQLYDRLNVELSFRVRRAYLKF
jgi:hypothetical protein